MITLWGFLCIWIFLSLLLEFSIFHISHFQCNMSWCASIWFILFGMLYLYLFLLQDWDISTEISLNIFSIPSLSVISFGDPCNGNIDMLDIIPNILYSIIIFFNFFYFCYSDWVISIILSSMSFMQSSVWPGPLFISPICFLFQRPVLTGLFKFFIFSSFSLKFSLCSSIFSPNSVSILTNNALTSLPSKMLISISLFVL